MKAFTLFEILVVMGIFSIVVVLTFPYSLKLINQSRADGEVKTLAYVIFRQQQDAYAGNKNKAYGIAFYSDKYIVFTGTSLATAESQDTYNYSSPVSAPVISLNSGTEVDFAANSFRPNRNGYIIVSDTARSYRLDITSEGLISYYGL